MTHPADASPLRSTMAAIDSAHPLVISQTGNVRHILPRLDRIETKDAYLIEYIEYLERRIASLETRLQSG